MANFGLDGANLELRIVPNGPVLFHVSTRDRAMFGSPSEILGRLCGVESPGFNWGQATIDIY
jgi:hypothetical protein